MHFEFILPSISIKTGAQDIKNLLKVVSGTVDEAKLNSALAALKGKNLQEVQIKIFKNKKIKIKNKNHSLLMQDNLN